MSEHLPHIQRCLELAATGLGATGTNPLVGCVITHNDAVIGSGSHERFGNPHAEVMALNSLSSTKKKLLSSSTLYVNLEPCVHTGKTPPCCPRIIQEGIRRVVIGCRDVNPKVSGQGVATLRRAGVEVIEDILKADCQFLNRRFETYHKQRRPYVILKWAQTQNGFVARSDYSSKWISSESSRSLVHRWRLQESAILVGTTTARVDNPRLSARPADFGDCAANAEQQPLRVVLDRTGSLHQGLHLFDGSQATLVFTEASDRAALPQVEYQQVSFAATFLQECLQQLFERGVCSLIVEGGSQTLNSFLEMNLWDEARVFVSATKFENGIAAPSLPHPPFSTGAIGNDLLTITYNTELTRLLANAILPHPCQ